MDYYAKLYKSIINSSVWDLSSETRIVWITLLALADHDGYVHAAATGVAHAARLSLDDTLVALDTLSTPDRHSRSPEHEGRRIARTTTGWHVLQYARYRQWDGQAREIKVVHTDHTDHNVQCDQRDHVHGKCAESFDIPDVQSPCDVVQNNKMSILDEFMSFSAQKCTDVQSSDCVHDKCAESLIKLEYSTCIDANPGQCQNPVTYCKQLELLDNSEGIKNARLQTKKKNKTKQNKSNQIDVTCSTSTTKSKSGSSKNQKSNIKNEYNEDFNIFWSQWPGDKIGRGRAQVIWGKKARGGSLPPVDVVIEALQYQDRVRTQRQQRGVWTPPWPNPATWLSQERWLDSYSQLEPVNEKMSNLEILGFY